MRQRSLKCLAWVCKVRPAAILVVINYLKKPAVVKRRCCTVSQGCDVRKFPEKARPRSPLLNFTSSFENESSFVEQEWKEFLP